MQGTGSGRGKKGSSSYKFRQGLSFNAQTPNFLKILQGGGVGKKEYSLEDKQIAENRDDEANDHDDGEDERPQVEIGHGISAKEAAQFLGASHDGSGKVAEKRRQDGSSDDEDSERDRSDQDDGDQDLQDGKIKYRKPKRSKKELQMASTSKTSAASVASAVPAATVIADLKAEQQRQRRSQLQSKAKAKSVRNSALLSFGGEDGE